MPVTDNNTRDIIDSPYGKVNRELMKLYETYGTKGFYAFSPPGVKILFKREFVCHCGPFFLFK